MTRKDRTWFPMIIEPTSPGEFFLSIRTQLLIGFTILLFYGFVYLMLKSRKLELVTTRRVMQGYALFALCFAFTRIFFLLSSYDNVVAYPDTGPMAEFWAVCGYAVTMASIAFVFLVVERFILQKKPIFAAIAFISFFVDVGAIVMMVLDVSIGIVTAQELSLYVQYIASPILGVAICVLYMMIIKNAAGEVRKSAILTFTGILLLLIGIILDISALSVIEWFTPIRSLLNPVFFIAGATVTLYSLRRVIERGEATT